MGRAVGNVELQAVELVGAVGQGLVKDLSKNNLLETPLEERRDDANRSAIVSFLLF